MFAVIFEVHLKPGKKEEYLTLAASLRPELEKIDGFLSIERFSSLSTEGKLLSISFWRDEQAVTTWREQEQHRQAQSEGKAHIFADYRIRVAQVARDYGMVNRAEVPPPP